MEQFLIDNNQELFFATLKQIVELRGGVTKTAKAANISRQHLYKILASKSNPTLHNISSLLSAVGFKLKVEVSKVA